MVAAADLFERVAHQAEEGGVGREDGAVGQKLDDGLGGLDGGEAASLVLAFEPRGGVRPFQGMAHRLAPGGHRTATTSYRRPPSATTAAPPGPGRAASDRPSAPGRGRPRGARRRPRPEAGWAARVRRSSSAMAG